MVLVSPKVLSNILDEALLDKFRGILRNHLGILGRGGHLHRLHNPPRAVTILTAENQNGTKGNREITQNLSGPIGAVKNSW